MTKIFGEKSEPIFFEFPPTKKTNLDPEIRLTPCFPLSNCPLHLAAHAWPGHWPPSGPGTRRSRSNSPGALRPAPRSRCGQTPEPVYGNGQVSNLGSFPPKTFPLGFVMATIQKVFPQKEKASTILLLVMQSPMLLFLLSPPSRLTETAKCENLRPSFPKTLHSVP